MMDIRSFPVIYLLQHLHVLTALLTDR